MSEFTPLGDDETLEKYTGEVVFMARKNKHIGALRVATRHFPFRHSLQFGRRRIYILVVFLSIITSANATCATVLVGLFLDLAKGSR